MKNNQNDLIFSIVFGVLGLIAFGIAIGTKPEPPTIPAPPTINVADAPLPATAVVYGNALPGGGAAAGGTGGFPGGSAFGGPPRRISRRAWRSRSKAADDASSFGGVESASALRESRLLASDGRDSRR